MKAYTTVERIFQNEFTCLRLCGGLMFDWPLPIAIIYRFIVLISFRYFITVHYAKYLPVIETYSKSTQQNIRVFLGFYTVSSYLASILAFYTGLKYRKLILELIRKKFDCRYLDGGYLMGEKSNKFSDINIRSTSYSTPSSGRISNWSGLSTRSTIGSTVQAALETHHFRRVKYFLLLYWMLSILTSYLRYWTYTTYLIRERIPSQRHLKVTDVYPPLIFREHVVRTDILERPSFRLPSQGESSGSIVSTYHLAISLVSSPWFKRKVSLVVGDIYHMIWDMLTSVTHFSQTYGNFILVLMITSVMTDMLRFSTRSDGISPSDSSQGLSGRETSKYSLGCVYSKPYAIKPTTCLLTTKLIIQIRDVLIILRCMLSIEYLVLLVGDFTRIMSVFCLLIETVNTYQTISVVVNLIEFGRIIYAVALTRIGHDWLHKEVVRVRRLLDQRFLLNEEGSQPSVTLRVQTISKGESITLNRLTEDIESIWGTDWYSPDFGTFIKHNIILMTFVATLQQLVEAGTQVNYLAVNSSVVSVATNSTPTRLIPKNWNDTLRVWVGA